MQIPSSMSYSNGHSPHLRECHSRGEFFRGRLRFLWRSIFLDDDQLEHHNNLAHLRSATCRTKQGALDSWRAVLPYIHRLNFFPGQFLPSLIVCRSSCGFARVCASLHGPWNRLRHLVRSELSLFFRLSPNLGRLLCSLPHFPTGFKLSLTPPSGNFAATHYPSCRHGKGMVQGHRRLSVRPGLRSPS